MTFLELCQRLRMEAGIAGTGPATVANQIGEAGRLVEWVKSAYQDIQDKDPHWQFLQKSATFNTISGQNSYPPSIATRLADWKQDTLRCYEITQAGEWRLRQWPWDNFRDTRLYGSSASQTGRPQDFAIDPQQNLVLWPTPDIGFDGGYTITGEYYQSAADFTVDADTPVFPRYHLAIVYNALMRYAAYAGEPALYAQAQKEYGRLINKLELEYTPALMLGGAMA